MRLRRCVVAVFVIIGLAGAVPAGNQEDKLMQEVAAIGDALAKAMVDNDTDVMLAMYAEDAISLPNYGPRMDGVDSFKKHHEEMSASGMKVVFFDSDPTEVWKAGNHVIEIGTYAIELEMPGISQAIKDKGKYMTVYVRGKDGSLKIKAETWNTDMNPMMMGDHGHDGGDHDHDH
jgi:ketosteroid isomerase-like protein